MMITRTIAASVAVAALALTGCSRPPAAAATVDGVRVPTAVVTATGDTLVQLGANPSIAYQQAAFDLMLGEASRQIAARTGTRVPDEDRAAVLAQNQNASRVAATPDGEAWGEAVSTTYVVLDALGQQAYTSRLSELDITVNPRFGTWDPQQITLVDSALSRSVDSLAVNR